MFVNKLQALRLIQPEDNISLFRLPHQIPTDLGDGSEDEMLSWREYFTLFLEIEDALSLEAEQQRKISWHPACNQFSMTPLPDQSPPGPPAPLPPPPPPPDADNPPDDFTEDEASLPGDEDADHEDEDKDEDKGEGEGEKKGTDGEERPGSGRPAATATLVGPAAPFTSDRLTKSETTCRFPHPSPSPFPSLLSVTVRPERPAMGSQQVQSDILRPQSHDRR